jgi:hypothetical protein
LNRFKIFSETPLTNLAKKTSTGLERNGRQMHVRTSKYRRLPQMESQREPLGFRSAKKVADFFDLSERTVRAKAATGEWPTYRVGGRRLFDLDELIHVIKSETTPAARAPSPEGAPL